MFLQALHAVKAVLWGKIVFGKHWAKLSPTWNPFFLDPGFWVEPRESGMILSAIRGILLLNTAKRDQSIADQYATIGFTENVVSAVEPHLKGNRMKNTFIILWAPGPAWVPGKTVREQPHWAQHATFMDELFENGMVVLGGPFADATGSLVIVEAENEHEVVDVFAHDPFVIHDIFALSLCKQWLLFLDARHKE